MINFLKEKVFISIIVIFIPILSFLNYNIESQDNVLFYSVFFITFFVITANFLISFFLSKLFNKISFDTLGLFFSFIFFSLFYLFQFFKDLFIFITPIYNAEISIIFLIFFIFLLFIIILNNRIILLKNFLIIYVFLIFVFNLSVFLFNFKNFLFLDKVSDPFVLVEKEDIDYLNQNKKKNIYYIIVDQAIPLDKFDEYYKTDYESYYLPKFSNRGFEYIKNTKSAYQNTFHNLTSLFFLDYHITEKNYNNYSLLNLFPTILKPLNIQKVPLIKNLQQIGYEFKWIGNLNYDCRYNSDLCLENNKKKKVIFSLNILNAFLHRSPILPVYIKIKSYFNSEVAIPVNLKNNDALNVFMQKNLNFNKKDKGYFFFIHSLIPHWPYTFNSDCSLKKGYEKIDLLPSQINEKILINDKKSLLNSEDEVKYYKELYECMLKRIDQFTEFLNKNDPSANVIITSDHGHDIKNHFILGYDTFVLVKKNKDCKQDANENLNTANAARLLLSCTVNKKIDQLKKKHYYINFKKGNMTIGGEFDLVIVDPENYKGIFLN